MERLSSEVQSSLGDWRTVALPFTVPKAMSGKVSESSQHEPGHDLRTVRRRITLLLLATQACCFHGALEKRFPPSQRNTTISIRTE